MTRKIITKTRKKPKTPSVEDTQAILIDFISGETNHQTLAIKYSTTSGIVAKILTRHWKTFTNLRESKLLIDSQKYDDVHKSGSYIALKSMGRALGMNEKFTDLLSEDDSQILSDHEVAFCLHYVSTGNSFTSVKESKLSVGLLQEKSEESRHKYKVACRLRSTYLKNKPNVAAFINQLKSEKFLPEVIDKQFVQRELLEQLELIKEDDELSTYRKKTLALKTIESIGRTVGAFSETLRIEKVDPAEALDALAKLNQVDARIVEPVLEIGS